MRPTVRGPGGGARVSHPHVPPFPSLPSRTVPVASWQLQRRSQPSRPHGPSSCRCERRTSARTHAGEGGRWDGRRPQRQRHPAPHPTPCLTTTARRGRCWDSTRRAGETQRPRGAGTPAQRAPWRRRGLHGQRSTTEPQRARRAQAHAQAAHLNRVPVALPRSRRQRRRRPHRDVVVGREATRRGAALIAPVSRRLLAQAVRGGVQPVQPARPRRRGGELLQAAVVRIHDGARVVPPRRRVVDRHHHRVASPHLHQRRHRRRRRRCCQPCGGPRRHGCARGEGGGEGVAARTRVQARDDGWGGLARPTPDWLQIRRRGPTTAPSTLPLTAAALAMQ
jgi:hypothetical protein